MQHSRSKTQPVVPVVGRRGGGCIVAELMMQDIPLWSSTHWRKQRGSHSGSHGECWLQWPSMETGEDVLNAVERPGDGLSDLP
jgi:hypothetical protein